ncbi:MAG: rod shape-determining protein MreC [Sphingobium sp.]|uniref:Cell shape-determining protein MreC n=1 Tax=Sphingobium xenophagum TaxID=121428 RepID=A0A249MVF4_SPHXE|nr:MULTISPECIES: rod shape-determining protein MreC [Sphingobium]MBU0774743.1 rod shape-determining protein MreC [Alphaproteobacteria bacterium]ASY45175.1 rod shape-determining protein MreC [Sphingobium xenophagum]MBA4755771.1 rod shape-determining protein MreC [Sphingobium sp.]MBG6116630.1 rod shape-determining protein MreC [Sphingobium sp. JAI105]MBS90776.1 rod shape-determining protein MreC [Sphingobium sp.]|tara:strand:+ start:565 stop:1479 length:915 start_codon:yes stop_codon:yes gene_type:complete
MARPPSRRPGHNRKAQYSLFASYVVAVTGAAIGLLLIVVAIFDPTGFAGIRAVTAELTRPVSVGLKNMVSGVSSIDEVLAAYWRAGSQNVALRRQVEADRNRIIEAKAVAQENARLKKLLKLVDEDASQLLTARLISSSSSSARRFARLNAGRWQGVQPGMPVRATEGLIGRVHSTTPNTSDVLLLTDSGSIVPVRRANDNVPAIATGAGDGSLEIRSLSAGRNPFKPGDLLVTSGIGGIYQPNIPVAVVVRVQGEIAWGFPLANPSRVDAVVVERAFEQVVTRPDPGAPAAAEGAEPGNVATP